MSKPIAWGKFKDLFKNCSDDTIINLSFLMSFEDIKNGLKKRLIKKKVKYF